MPERQRTLSLDLTRLRGQDRDDGFLDVQQYEPKIIWAVRETPCVQHERHEISIYVVELERIGRLELWNDARRSSGRNREEVVVRLSTLQRGGAFVVLGLALLALWSKPRVEAQVVVAEREQATLGSVHVGKRSVSVMIAYQADSALLVVAVPGSSGNQRYIPLIASTYRGVPSFRLDLLSPDSNDEMRIRMSGPQQEVLAHYRFGEETALTQFGRVQLLETPFPEHLSGGPVPFPKEGSDVSRLRATFYHYDD